MAARAPAGQCFPPLDELRANPLVKRVGEKKHVVEVALDLSSTCVGWAVGLNRTLARYGKFVFKSTAETGEKLVSFEEFLSALLEIYQPDRLLIERPMSRRAETTARHWELVGVSRTLWRHYSGGEVLKSWIISPKVVKDTMQVKKGGDHDDNKAIMVRKINSLYNLRLHYHKDSAYQSDDDTADAIAVLTTYWRRNARG